MAFMTVRLGPFWDFYGVFETFWVFLRILPIGAYLPFFPTILGSSKWYVIELKKTSHSGENSQRSHQKSPKTPYGGISPNLLNKTCRASNSVWKVGPMEEQAFLMIFEMLLRFS